MSEVNGVTLILMTSSKSFKRERWNDLSREMMLLKKLLTARKISKLMIKINLNKRKAKTLIKISNKLKKMSSLQLRDS